MFKNRRSRASSQSEYLKLQTQHFREGGANAISYITSFRNQGWTSDALDWLLYARRKNTQNWLPLNNTDDVIKMMIAKDKVIQKSKVLILGFAFKENCPDVRNTKIVDVVKALDDYGIKVTIFDPLANPAEVQHEYKLKTTELLLLLLLHGPHTG